MPTPKEKLLYLIEAQPDSSSSEEIVKDLLPYTTGHKRLPIAAADLPKREGLSWAESRKRGLKMSAFKDALVEAIEQQPDDSSWEHLARELFVHRTLQRAGSWTKSNSAKEEVMRLICDLPQDVSLADIDYHVSLFNSIQESEEDFREGRGIPHEEVVKQMAKWLER